MRIFLVGLGNADKLYVNTRHNIGHIFIDYVVKELGLNLIAGKGEYAYTGVGNFFIFKNLTYMNVSGSAVKKIAQDFNIEVEKELFICHDDLDMAPYTVKAKYGGGSGGHKGIESCIFHLETENFYRVKFGMGKSVSLEPKEYVLSPLSPDELILFKESFKIAFDGLNIMIKEGIGKGITYINTKGRRLADG